MQNSFQLISIKRSGAAQASSKSLPRALGAGPGHSVNKEKNMKLVCDISGYPQRVGTTPAFHNHSNLGFGALHCPGSSPARPQ